MRALLSDFLDHTLHWRAARALQAHLSACPPCARFVVSVEQTIVLYRERPVVDVPPAVRGHLRELLRERHAAAPKKSPSRCGLKSSPATPAKARQGRGKRPAKKPAGRS
ncbi:MAG TPA: anti-sigma factor [bacterium]